MAPPAFSLIPGTLARSGTAATPGYIELCATPAIPILIRASGDTNNDGHPSWLQYYLVVESPYSLPARIAWGGALVTWSRP